MKLYLPYEYPIVFHVRQDRQNELNPKIDSIEQNLFVGFIIFHNKKKSYANVKIERKTYSECSTLK